MTALLEYYLPYPTGTSPDNQKRFLIDIVRHAAKILCFCTDSEQPASIGILRNRNVKLPDKSPDSCVLERSSRNPLGSVSVNEPQNRTFVLISCGVAARLVTEIRLLHLQNAQLSIEITLFGIVIEVKLLQFGQSSG